MSDVIWGPDEHHVHTPEQLQALADVMSRYEINGPPNGTTRLVCIPKDEYEALVEAVDKWAARCVEARKERDSAILALRVAADQRDAALRDLAACRNLLPALEATQ